ncbi:MAG: T9SS type A sorting domain-containing protein [Bacteroidales bacterium]|nr:T9SS type A sorting domain-containing protein [Bacteroidales bacterium]
MKRAIILLILNGWFLVNYAQQPEWEVYIGLSNRNESVRELIECYDKGYYLEGGHWITNQPSKGWNVKTDINGCVLWEKNLVHASGTVKVKAAVMDNAGNRYVGGIIFFDGPDWPFVAKFNACGEKVWCKTLPKQGYLQGWVTGMVIDSHDQIIVSLQYTTAQLIDKIFLVAFNPDGDVLWQNVYATLSNYPWLRDPVIYSMIGHNNEYYLSGYCYWPYPNNPSHVFLRLFFIGIDSLFNEKWILPFAPLDAIWGKAYNTIPLNDSVLMGVGLRRTSSGGDGLLIFYNINGQELGYNQIFSAQIAPNIISNYLTEIKRIDETTFIASGFYEPVYSTFYNIDLVTDTSAVLFNHSLKPNAIGFPNLIKTSDNNYAVATEIKIGNALSDISFYKFNKNLQSVPFDTNPRVYDSLCPHPIQSGTIDMSDCMVWVGTEDIPTPDMYYAGIRTIPITVYPNPANDKITFAFENTEHHKNIVLKCYNLLGVQQYETRIAQGHKESATNVSSWSAGMYVAVVYSEGRPVGRVKFVVAR